MGKSTSLRSAPDHRIAENVSAIVPGPRMLASSTHPSGEAPPVVGPPAVGLGSGLLLGGELFCPLSLPLPLPCACTGNEKASASTALAITETNGPGPRITNRRRLYR